MNMLIALAIAGCIHWVELVEAINEYTPKQVQQVLLKSRYLPGEERMIINRAIDLVRWSKAHGKDPVRTAMLECGLKEA